MTCGCSPPTTRRSPPRSAWSTWRSARRAPRPARRRSWSATSYEVDAARLEYVRERIRRGTSVTAVAENEHGPVAVGTLRPVGDVAEIVAVATLPAVRRQGLGGAVTALLVEHALEHGVETRLPVRRERRRRARLRAPRLPSHRHGLLRAVNAIEHYYDAVPRSAARVEEIGPFTLFVGTGAWPYYARPRLGLRARVHGRGRSRPCGRASASSACPRRSSGCDETTPSLLAASRVAGLEVMLAPLMVLERRGAGGRARGRDRAHARRRRSRAGSPPVVAQDRGFGGTGEGVRGARGRSCASALAQRRDPDGDRRELATACVAAGAHQPVGDVTEIVGVATVPEARRRGIAGALTARSSADAARSSTVFLSAGDGRRPRLRAARLPPGRDRLHRRVIDRPALAGVLGALVIAFSAILVDLADVSPVSAALWRCAYALPPLGVIAWCEHRRYGPRSRARAAAGLRRGRRCSPSTSSSGTTRSTTSARAWRPCSATCRS